MREVVLIFSTCKLTVTSRLSILQKCVKYANDKTVNKSIWHATDHHFRGSGLVHLFRVMYALSIYAHTNEKELFLYSWVKWGEILKLRYGSDYPVELFLSKCMYRSIFSYLVIFAVVGIWCIFDNFLAKITRCRSNKQTMNMEIIFVPF